MKRIFFIIPVLVLISSCVSKQKYVDAMSKAATLQSTVDTQAAEAKKLLVALEQKQRDVIKLRADSIKMIQGFDYLANTLIKQGNANISLLNEEYRKTMTAEIANSNQVVVNLLRYLFADRIRDAHIEIKSNNGNIRLVLRLDSLYDSDSIRFNPYGQEIIDKLNSPEVKSSLRDYYTTGRNEVQVLTDDGEKDTLAAPSFIFEEFIQESKSFTVRPPESDWNFSFTDIPEDYKITGQSIIIEFSKGIKSLSNYYADYTVVNAKLVTPEKNYPYATGYGMASRTREISISYPPNESIKYLIYPSDFITLKLANANDPTVIAKMTKLGSIKRTIVMTGNDRQVIDCDCKKAIIVVHDKKVIKKYPARQINCNTGVLNLEE